MYRHLLLFNVFAALNLIAGLALGGGTRRLEDIPSTKSPRVETDTPVQGKTTYRDITVEGRFGYVRDDGVFIGARDVLVNIRDDELINSDTLALVRTDENGYFSATFFWNGGYVPKEDHPDIFILFELEGLASPNTASQLADHEFRSWELGTWDDFTGTYLDVGARIPDTESNQSAVHIYHVMSMAAQVLDDLELWQWTRVLWGEQVEESECCVDTGPTYAHIAIAVRQEDYWRDDVLIGLVAERFLDLHAVDRELNLCNGVCDSGGCGWCHWCPENSLAAFQNGLKLWLMDYTARTVGASLETPLRDMPSIEFLDDCQVAAEDPAATAGHFAAFLRDIEDESSGEDHPQYPGLRDRLDWGPEHILYTIADEAPVDPYSFIFDLVAAYPSYCSAIWETAANCGFDIDLGDPGAPGGLNSSTHEIGVPSPDATVEVHWVNAWDDCSGVHDYSYSFTSTPEMPDTTVDLEFAISVTSAPLPSETWYFNVRAVDRSGRWSDEYATYGPIIIDDPTPANLVHQLQPGWSNVVVPRSNAAASPGNVAAPSVLLGDDDTWWNVAPRNDGSQSTGMTLGAQLYLDGNAIIDFFNPGQPGWATFPALTGFSHSEVLNAGPVQVQPGRHMMGVLLDGGEQLIEADETDNGWAKSWAWIPPVMTPDAALGANSVPDYNGGWEWWGGGVLWPNSFGARFLTDGRWNAVYAFADHDDSDFDLHLYDASASPEDAFFNAVEQSNRGVKFLDAVFVNRELTGGHQAWDVGIINGDFEPDSGTAGYGQVTSTSISFGVPYSDQLDGGEPMHLLDFDLPAGSTGPVSIVVDIDPADGQLTILKLDSDYDMGPIAVHNGIGVTDENGDARLFFTLPDPGNMCVVLYRNKWNNDYFETVPYTLTVETTPPDLRPRELAGWHAPVVPRNTNDGTPSTVLAPTQLTGWDFATWLNVTQENIGPTTTPGSFFTSFEVDGVELYYQSVPGGIAAGSGHVFNNLGTFLVRGGRHTLSVHSDSANEVYELSETNNSYGEQWVWSPYQLGFEPLIGAPQPESPTAGWETVDPLVSGPLWFNCDGFRTPYIDPAVNQEFWVAVAVAPSAGSDVDLQLHDPVADVKTGFQDPLATSSWGIGETDFVLMNYWLDPEGSFDVGVVGSFGTGGYQLDVATAEQHGVPAGTHGPFALGDGELVGLHEFILEPGFYWMELQDLSATADLGFSIHGWQQLHQGKSDHLEDGIAYTGPTGNYEQMKFIVDELQTGPYCVAVWKRSGADASAVADYALKFITITDAPSAGPVARAGITEVAPNPFNPRTEVKLHLDRQGDAAVTIYNVRGELVRTLHRGPLPAGENKLRWEGRDDQGGQVASGVYIVELRATGVSDRRKITLLK